MMNQEANNSNQVAIITDDGMTINMTYIDEQVKLEPLQLKTI